MRISLFIIILFFLSNISFASQDTNGLQLIDPWVRQAPPTAKNLAGYGELKNNSDKVIEVLSITSGLFEKVEMHITTFENGMMKMAEVENMMLKPGESVYFEPGGRHFMLIKPNTAIKAGLIVPVKILLKTGQVLNFDMMVRR